MACWLVLGDDVYSIKYKPGQTEYLLTKGNVGIMLKTFLRDVEAEFDELIAIEGPIFDDVSKDVME